MKGLNVYISEMKVSNCTSKIYLETVQILLSIDVIPSLEGMLIFVLNAEYDKVEVSYLISFKQLNCLP